MEQSTISLTKLQEVINQLAADIDQDIETLRGNLELNRGARLGINILVSRIQEALTPAETVGEVEVLPPADEEALSSDYSSPI